MGGGLDVVLAVLSAAAAVGQFAVALAAWRDARRPRSTITVIASGSDDQQVQAVLRALRDPGDGE